MDRQIPDAFERHATGRYWGVSPESLLLYNNATIDGSDAAWQSLRQYYDLTVYITNHRVEWDSYTTVLGNLRDAWFTPASARLAQHVTPATAKQFVLGAAYEAEGGVMRLLRMGQEYVDDHSPEASLVIPDRDARSVADDQDINLLRTLDVLRARRDGYQLDRDAIQTLYGSRELTRAEACWAIIARLCQAHGITDLETIVSPLLEGFDIMPPDTPPETVAGSLPIYAGDDRIEEFVEAVFSTDAADVFIDLETTNRKRAELLERTIGIRSTTSPEQTPAWPLSDAKASVCAIASQHGLPVACDWLLDEDTTDDMYTLHRLLADAGLSVSLKEELLVFEEAYGGPNDPDALARYEEWVEQEREKAAAIANAALRLWQHVDDAWCNQRDALLAAAMDRLEEITVDPIRFTFTLFDPVHHADEYEIDEYMGDSPHLEEEINRIREWRANQPHDAVTFVDQVREICARPLEDDTVAPRLRVMSPWMNFTIQEYTALFQRLLENDVRVQLLFRLPDPREWTNLKQNFLTRLGDTHRNINLRTYTRYKKFKDHTQLRKLKRGEIDDEGDQYVSETGIHAKLFIAGEPEQGAVLAGSANLMENSFYYNPEAGLHTRHPEVIDTAIEYFDLVWDLAEPDRIDESTFTAETNFEFYPKVYRP